MFFTPLRYLTKWRPGTGSLGWISQVEMSIKIENAYDWVPIFNFIQMTNDTLVASPGYLMASTEDGDMHPAIQQFR